MTSSLNETHRLYSIWFDLYEIAGFDYKKPIKAKLEIGKHFIETQYIKWEKHRWNLDTPSGYFKDWLLKLPTNPDDFPDVNLKILTHDKREIERCVAEYELDPEMLLEIGSTPTDPTWHVFTNLIDKNDESLKSHLTGSALFSLNITAVGRFEYFRPKRKQIKYVPYEIRFMICQAQGIQISDIAALSDPFVVVSINGVSKKTPVIRETLNPQWNLILRWRIDLPDNLSICTSFVIDLWDLDDYPASNELLGTAQIPYNQIPIASSDNERFPAGKWLSLNSPMHRLPPRVLYSAMIFKLNSMKHEIPTSPLPEWMKPLDCNLKMLIISTQQLVALGSKGVQKPFIILEAKETSFQTSFGVRSDLKQGNNHNYLELTNIPIKVFKDPKYAPCINLKVFDKGPLRNSLLGFAMIDLAQYYTWNKQHQSYTHEESKHQQSIFSKLMSHSTVPSHPTKHSDSPTSSHSSTHDYILPQYSSVHNYPSQTSSNKTHKYSPYTPVIIHEETDNYFDMTQTHTDRKLLQPESDPYPNYNPQGFDRPAINCSFEEKFNTPLPYDTFELMRQTENGENIHAGYIKLAIKLIPYYEEENNSLEKLMEDFKTCTEIVARFYILRITDLQINQAVDSSIFIWMKTRENNNIYKFDNQTYTATSSSFIMNTYTLHIKLPDECKVNLAIWSKESTSKENFIGMTEIDIEDRWFNKDYKRILNEDIKLIPQETRILYDEKHTEQKGKLTMWVELFTEKDAVNYPQEILSAANTCDYELRVVIWNLIELDLDEKADLVVQAKIHHPEERKVKRMTDIHYDAKKSAVFNWRLLLPIRYPCPDSQLYIKLLKKTGSIYLPLGTAKINMHDFYQSVHRFLSKQYLPKAEIKIYRYKESSILCKIWIEGSMLLLEDAQEDPVGEGRSQPNQDPPLSAPTSGRVFKELKGKIEEIGETFVKRERNYKYWIALVFCLILCIIVPIVLATYLT